MKTRHLLATLSLAACAAAAPAAQPLAPYGTAKVDMHAMNVTDVVFDVNYADPQDLRFLYGFIKNTAKETRGKVVVVTHGPELRAFAKENYEKYQGIIDQLAELAQNEGVEFKMCNNAMKAAGFAAEDMHGFITVIPAGFAELAYWQSRGFQYMNPAPNSPRDVRYLEHPELKK